MMEPTVKIILIFLFLIGIVENQTKTGMTKLRHVELASDVSGEL